jgi:hypothetical protein
VAVVEMPLVKLMVEMVDQVVLNLVVVVVLLVMEHRVKVIMED